MFRLEGFSIHNYWSRVLSKFASLQSLFSSFVCSFFKNVKKSLELIADAVKETLWFWKVENESH